MQVPRTVVKGGTFDQIVSTYSGAILRLEMVRNPVKIWGEMFVCTSLGLSHSNNWATCYSIQRMDKWEGPVHVYGATDEEWVRRVQITKQHWYGFRVYVEGDDSATEYVLGRKTVFVREDYPKVKNNGQNYKGM